jgi:hypothetical protein
MDSAQTLKAGSEKVIHVVIRNQGGKLDVGGTVLFPLYQPTPPSNRTMQHAIRNQSGKLDVGGAVPSATLTHHAERAEGRAGAPHC